MIVTFYSFKGGVGRSMAVANVGDILARRGLEVLMIDFDLEAPGLEQYFQIKQSAARRHEGLLDLLLAYKRSMSVVASGAADQFRDVERFIVPIYEKLPGGGRLDLMPAGQREPREQLDRYASNLRSFDWQDFYVHWEGELFFEWLRSALVPDRYDLVLVDSRTGVTEMGGICTYQLADAVFMMTAANHQNRQGTLNVAADFQSLPVQTARRERPLEIVAVPARVEQRDPRLTDAFIAEFEHQFAAYLPSGIRQAGLGFRDLLIPYEPAYAFEERVLSDPARAAERGAIGGAFERLADAVCALVPSLKGAAAAPAATRAERPSAVQYDAAKRFAGYDAFLAYHAGDAEAARRLGEHLRAAGVVVFEDRLELAHAEDWRARTEHALFHSRLCIMCYGAQGLTRTQGVELASVCESIAASHDLTLVPVLLPGGSPERYREDAPPILQRMMWVDLREGFDTAAGRDQLGRLTALQRATVSGSSGAPASSAHAAPSPTTAAGAPYPGARPFTEADAEYFFGRDDVVAQALDVLDRHRLAVVTGPSACGKTSLVSAGLIARLQRRSEPLTCERLVVDREPLPALEAALARAPAAPGPRLLLIDQLERLLRGASPDGVRTYLQRIANAVADADGPRIVLAARDVRLAELAGAAPPDLLAPERRVVMPMLTEAELRDIIERPAERAGLAFEPGLVDRLILDWGQDQRFLPFLQAVLHELWARRREGFLTNQAYTEIPDPVEATAEHAWSTLPERLKPMAERVIPRLVTLCGNLVPLDRSCQPRDLLLSGMEIEDLKTLIWHMVDSRLFHGFADAQGQIRIAPAFAAEQWDRAAAWMEAHEGFHVWLARLDTYRHDWERNGRDRDALLAGALLAEATEWQTKAGGDLSRAETEFIELSRAAQARKRRRRAMVAAGVVLVFAGLFLFGSWTDRQERAADARVQASIQQGDRLTGSGDPAAAADAYSRALRDNPDDTTALMRRATALDALGRFDEALGDLTRVIEITSTSPAQTAPALLADAYLARATTHLHRNDTAAALADLNQAARHDPSDAVIQASRAGVLAQLGRNEAALAGYREALRLNPDFADAAFARGTLYQKLGRAGDATKDFQRVASMSSASSQTQTAARIRLEQLGKVTAPAAPRRARVFLHIADEKDRPVAAAVSAALREKQYVVEGVELMEKAVHGDVRFFFKEDERSAEDIRLVAEAAIAEQGFNVSLDSSYLTAFASAKPGTVEVWLPSLSTQVIQQQYVRPRRALMKRDD